MCTSRMIELSSRIAASTAILNDHFVANHLPTPSFDVDGRQDTLVPKRMVDVKAARAAITDDTEELRRLVLWPRDYLMSYSADELLSQHAITRFRLAHLFPVGGEATFGEIAAISGLSETIVRQIIRHSVVKDILQELRPGVVSHNSLAKDTVIDDRVSANCQEFWPAVAQPCDSMARFPESEVQSETMSGSLFIFRFLTEFLKIGGKETVLSDVKRFKFH
ncbi:hypothetical protein DL770_007949 [Monosporascus sp. CRB-9-2]|nr:hypothetical protein DL770_007949 [Monosporascus sp. CRB-9-2]